MAGLSLLDLSLISFIILASLAMATLWRARGWQERSGLPAGEVIYTDAGTWYPQSDPLTAPDLQLVGRPDYLVEQADGAIIPVEVKSSPAPTTPHEGHVLQLAAYCLLVHSAYGRRPPHGILQYRDAAYAIEFTPELEEDLLDLLSDMRQDLFADGVDRDHNDWHRCRRCGLRGSCIQRLA